MTRSAACVAAVAAAMAMTEAATSRAQVAPPSPSVIAVGDWQITPLAEVRVRGEYRYDFQALDQWTLLERARLGADAQDGAVEARVVVQDARAMLVGDAPIAPGDPAPVAYAGAHEAWVEAHSTTRGGTFLRVGRQPVVWGEGRLLGASDWSATGRSLDAARGRVVVGDGAFELLGAVLVDPATPASLHSYGELAAARGEWVFDPLLGLDASVIWRVAHTDPAADNGGSVLGRTGTGDLLVHGRGSGWAYGVEGAYQLGHADTPDLERSAFAVAGHVSKQLENVGWQPTFDAGVSYATGDHWTGGVFGGFDPILPDAHAWHGAMDLVSWSNEFDAGGGAHAATWQDGDIGVEYRYFPASSRAPSRADRTRTSSGRSFRRFRSCTTPICRPG